MSFFKSILGAINGKENLSAKRIDDLVKKKSSTGLGGFVDLNNDLGLMVDELQNHDPSILMPYFYARRGAAAGMFSQGAIDKQAFDQVDSLFFNFMAQVGSKITKDEQVKFQEDSLDRALELESKYYVGATRKSRTLLIVAAKQGISMRDALLNTLEYDQDELKNIVKPVMCSDWVMQSEFCMGFFASGAWEPSDDFDMTSRKVLKYFETIGMPFETPSEDILNFSGENHVANEITKGVNERIHSTQTAFQFVLEELDAARQGNEEAIQFVKNSGFIASEYEGAMQNSFEDVDGPNGPQQFLLASVMQYSSNMDFMVNLRLQVVQNIINKWELTTQSDVPQKEKESDETIEKQNEIISKLSSLSESNAVKTCKMSITPLNEIWSWEFEFSDEELETANELVSILYDLRNGDFIAPVYNIVKRNESSQEFDEDIPF